MKKYENMRHGTEAFPVGIHDTLCQEGFSLYPHIHREFEFLVMTEGKGIIYVEEEKFELKKGEGIFINSEELHIGIKTDSERAQFFAVVFAPEIFGSFAMDTIVEKYVEPVMKKEILPKRLLDKKTIELLVKLHDTKSELIIKSLLFEVWDMCIESAQRNGDGEKSKSIEDIKRVMEYIRKNACSEITLESIAEYAGMSKGYLCREFKRVVHMTPFEYIIQIRIDKSCTMLKNTNLQIGVVGENCGFNSFSYFTKIFKDRVGCSPKEYRQRR